MGVNFQGKKRYVTLKWPPKEGRGGKVYGSELRICTVQRDQCTVTSRLSHPTLVLRGHSSVT